MKTGLENLAKICLLAGIWFNNSYAYMLFEGRLG